MSAQVIIELKYGHGHYLSYMKSVPLRRMYCGLETPTALVPETYERPGYSQGGSSAE